MGMYHIPPRRSRVADRSYVGGGADVDMATAVYATAMMQMAEAEMTQGLIVFVQAGNEDGKFAM